MMKILQGKRARNFREAITLAFQEARVDDMSAGVTDLFSSTVDPDKLGSAAEKAIGATIRSRYKKSRTWDSERWYIPIPMLHYDTRDIPHLTIEIRVHLVAAVEIETTDDFYCRTLVGAIGNPEKLVLPMLFLLAILDDDLDRFRLVAKDGKHTTWEVPGTKPLELPNDFLDKLSQILQRKSVANWLLDLGSQGRSVAPSVVGTLWGLQLRGIAQPLSAEEQAWSQEFIVNTLEGLGYSTKEANQMFNRAAPDLRADHSKEETIRIVLQRAGKGE